MIKQTLIACPACDLLHRRGSRPSQGTARCVRCGNTLYRQRRVYLDRSLALTLTALVLLAMANLFPFINLTMEGRMRETVLVTGLFNLYGDGYLGLAVLVLLTGIVGPLLQLVGLAYVLFPLRWGRPAPKAARVYRWVHQLQPWAMTEIYMLGILVTVAKLTDMGSVVPGMGLYSFAALLIVMPMANASLDPDRIWESMPIYRAA